MYRFIKGILNGVGRLIFMVFVVVAFPILAILFIIENENWGDYKEMLGDFYRDASKGPSSFFDL